MPIQGLLLKVIFSVESIVGEIVVKSPYKISMFAKSTPAQKTHAAKVKAPPPKDQCSKRYEMGVDRRANQTLTICDLCLRLLFNSL